MAPLFHMGFLDVYSILLLPMRQVKHMLWLRICHIDQLINKLYDRDQFFAAAETDGALFCFEMGDTSMTSEIKTDIWPPLP